MSALFWFLSGFVVGFVVAAIAVASLMHRAPLYNEQTGVFEDAP